jgi:hypothetical protein
VTRLQTYRAFLAAMSPSSNPSEALARGYYVEPPGGGVWSDLTKKLELEPASTHLVLGGIGSGKTSALLRARDRLCEVFQETGDLVWYCDVSRRHDLAAPPEPGVLFALAGDLLVMTGDPYIWEDLDADKDQAARALVEFARGRVVLAEPGVNKPYKDLHPVRFDVLHGVLQTPPDQRIHQRIGKHAEHLQRLLAHYPGEGRSASVLFDSLDRLPDPAAFKSLVEDDIRALKSAGVGVVVVGPVRFIVGSDRSLTDLFDHVHFQLAFDPRTPDGMQFLCEVLRRRAQPSGLLPEECLRSQRLREGSCAI